MRKIFSAALALVCIWFATPARAALPTGYTQLEYITASGTQWLNTGIKLASTDIVETEFKNTSTTNYGALYGVFGVGESSAFYANRTYYGYDVENNKVDTGISVDSEWHTSRHDFGNGVITVDGIDTTYTPFEFENSNDNYLFARYYNGSYGYGFMGSGKRYKIIRNGVVICDLIPVVQLSDNAVGMYDLVNNVFRGNLGTGEFVAGPVAEIKIATTKYNESAFGPLNTALQNAISVVDTVVSNTITQAGRIATLQAQKQTRPNDIADDNEKCPAGKKCLLVEDASGIPHWYEIVENAWDLPVGYTQLEYIKSTGTQYIDTGIIATNWDWSVEFEMSVPQAGDMFFGAGRGLWGSTEWGAQFGLANSSGNANWGFGSGGMNVVISNLGVRTDTFYNYKMTKEGLYINGELKSRNTATESFSNSDLSLWICKTNNPGTSGYNKAGSSWKYVRIYNADTALVFNGVPAKNPDGKIGMYDKVSGEFFENKGTGDFIAGPVAQ